MKREWWASSLSRAAVAVLPLVFVGCVPYQQYELVKSERDKYKGAYDDLTTKYNRALQDILRLQKDGGSNDSLLQKVARLEQLNDELRGKLAQMAKGPSFTPEDIKGLPADSGVELEGEGIRLGENILFNSGEPKLKSPKAREVLDSLADLLQKNYPNQIINISGHTDTDPLKSTKHLWKTNQRLAYERANTVFNYFLDRGIPESRMVIHSFAYLQPIAPNDTSEGKARNRRVVLTLGGTKL